VVIGLVQSVNAEISVRKELGGALDTVPMQVAGVVIDYRQGSCNAALPQVTHFHAWRRRAKNANAQVYSVGIPT